MSTEKVLDLRNVIESKGVRVFYSEIKHCEDFSSGKIKTHMLILFSMIFSAIPSNQDGAFILCYTVFRYEIRTSFFL